MAKENDEQKKAIEAWALAAARKAGAPIPTGEIPGDKPDFRFKTGTGGLGIEVTELLRSAPSKGGFPPVAEETFHQEVIKMAEKEYYRMADATPVRVVLYFADAKGKKRSKSDMARSL